MFTSIESATMEFKERMSDSFLKTVSAYANYDGGIIVFGVSDSGDVVGVEARQNLECRLRIKSTIVSRHVRNFL